MQYESITAISLKAKCLLSILFNFLAEFLGMNLHSAEYAEILKNVMIINKPKFFMSKSYRLYCIASISLEKITYLSLYIFLLHSIFPVNSAAYESKNVITDMGAPLYNEDSQNILLYGSIATAVLVTQRENFVDPLSVKYGEEEKPMGDLAIFGDYMGQLVPNLAYMGFQYYEKTNESKRRLNYMFKTTLYTGLTTGILKRTINQRRPHKGDRLSFPSGHTSTAFAFAGVILYEYENVYYSVGAFAMATIVGLSRINDNAHYLHDVVFGATLGMAYARAFKVDENPIIFYPTVDGDKIGLNYSASF